MSGRQQHHRYKEPLQAVIFDWAGTILDYGSRAPVLAIVEAFRRCGLPISVEQVRGPMGLAKRDHLRAVLEIPAVQEHWRELHGRSSGESDVEEIYWRFLPLQCEALAAHADLIPGCLDTVEHCRRRGMRIGTSTGYTRDLINVLAQLASEKGLTPDAIVCADDVTSGRPAPWMCLENAKRLNVFPMEAIVNVDDTEVGIEAGLNAGMWTVGIAKSGNLVGLTETEINQLDPQAREQRIRAASLRLQATGAHFVIDTVADLPAVLDEVEQRLRCGDRP